MTRIRWAVIGIVLALVIAWLALARGGEKGQEVELARAESRELFRSFVNASGEILAERYADVGSSVMGRVVELPVTEGEEVSAGDLLARIDPIQARSELQAAEAAIQALAAEAKSASEQVVAARAELELAEAEARESTIHLERMQALYRQQLVPASELDAARPLAESRNARGRSARAAVARSQSTGEAAERQPAARLPRHRR